MSATASTSARTIVAEEEMITRLLPAHGRLFVISGPSGVGKGTVIAALLQDQPRPGSLTKCITATTRPPRPGEIPGRSYLFFSRQEFQNRAANGYFLEHVTYNGHRYGTPKQAVMDLLDSGTDVLLEIEVQGGIAIKQLVPEAVLVFLCYPSREELERRLRSRGTDQEPDIQRRLSIAHQEILSAPEYDYLIINDRIADAVDRLRAIVIAERCRIRRPPHD